jgi:hypothetical protein
VMDRGMRNGLNWNEHFVHMQLSQNELSCTRFVARRYDGELESIPNERVIQV